MIHYTFQLCPLCAVVILLPDTNLYFILNIYITKEKCDIMSVYECVRTP